MSYFTFFLPCKSEIYWACADHLISDSSHFKCSVTTRGSCWRIRSSSSTFEWNLSCSFPSLDLPIFNCKRPFGWKVSNGWMSSVVNSWWPSLDPSAFFFWKQGSGYWLLHTGLDIFYFNCCIWRINPDFKSCTFSTWTGEVLRKLGTKEFGKIEVVFAPTVMSLEDWRIEHGPILKLTF